MLITIVCAMEGLKSIPQLTEY